MEYQSQQPPPPPPQYQQYSPRPPAPKGQGMAIASMVLGICSLVIPYAGLATAIVGLILGIMAKKQLQEQGAPYGMATAGLVCSIIGLAGAVLVVVLCSSAACAIRNAIPYYY